MGDDRREGATLELTEPRQMRALAHPLRLQLLGALRIGGPSTATALGAQLDVGVSLVSYHLRQLARHGFVEEAPEAARDGRERWWQASHTRTRWSRVAFLDTPEREAAERALSAEVLRRYFDAAAGWLERAPEWPREWVEAADSGDWLVDVTPTELERLRRELVATIERYASPSSDAGDRRPVQVILNIVPRGRPPR